MSTTKQFYSKVKVEAQITKAEKPTCWTELCPPEGDCVPYKITQHYNMYVRIFYLLKDQCDNAIN